MHLAQYRFDTENIEKYNAMPVANARTMHLETVVKSGFSTQCGNKMCILRMLKWQLVHNLSIACVRFEVKVYFCKNSQDWNLKLFQGEVQTFLGNQKTHNDHFKLRDLVDGTSLPIGARNAWRWAVIGGYLAGSSIVKHRSQVWAEDECNNYSRVLSRQEGDRLLVCGTNSCDPRCPTHVINEAVWYQVARVRQRLLSLRPAAQFNFYVHRWLHISFRPFLFNNSK